MYQSASADDLSQTVSIAVGLHRDGHLDDAEKIYQRVLKREPNHVDALHFLGVLYHQRGDMRTAARMIRKALRLDPSYVGALINMGNILKEQGLFADAETEYRAALRYDANNADAYNNLGAVLRAQNKFDQAIIALEKATTLSPNNGTVFQNLGNALKSAERIEEALTAYRRAIEIDPRHCDAHLTLGRALYRFGRIDEAATVYRKWLEVEPDNPVAVHMLASCLGGQDAPERCSGEFVRQSFDAFACSFDEVLGRLQYRAPELVGLAIRTVFPVVDRKLAVLDAGCGTGLGGSWMRPYAKHLVGIDLSSKMVAKAQQTGLYDVLRVMELTDFMDQNPNKFDLIVSTDTLVYFGALQSVFDAAAASLKQCGTLVCTLEVAADELAPSGYLLNPHGRYSHTERFVKTALDKAGFTINEIRHDSLRLEMSLPVQGLVITAQKKQSSEGA